MNMGLSKTPENHGTNSVERPSAPSTTALIALAFAAKFAMACDSVKTTFGCGVEATEEGFEDITVDLEKVAEIANMLVEQFEEYQADDIVPVAYDTNDVRIQIKDVVYSISEGTGFIELVPVDREQDVIIIPTTEDPEVIRVGR